MASISLRLNADDEKMIKKYVKMNNLNLSSFVRDAVLDVIEDDFYDTDKILKAEKASKKGKVYDAKDIWEKLGV